ncbi:MAG: YncE family protein [Nitrospiraceae bacterium]|nr:MAG: YncE family protein [Nitrospiraceae bacterium]
MKKNNLEITFKVLLTGLLIVLLSACGGGGGGGSNGASESGQSGIEQNAGMKVYVSGINGVASIDHDTRKVTRIWDGVGDYLGIAVSPDGGFVYFSEYWSGYVLRYNTTNKAIDGYQARPGANGIDITLDGQYILLASTSINPVLTIIDAIKEEAVEVPLIPSQGGEFGAPRDVVVTPDKTAIYLSTGSYSLYPQQQGMVVGYITAVYIMPNDEFMIEPLKVGGDPSGGLAMSPDGNYLYASSLGDVIKVNLKDPSEVTLIDTVNNRFGSGIAVSPDGRWVYASSGVTGYINIIDTQTDEVVNSVYIKNVVIAGTAIFGTAGIAFTPDGKYAYVCSAYDVYVINTETQTVVGEAINVGFRAFAVAIGR